MSRLKETSFAKRTEEKIPKKKILHVRSLCSGIVFLITFIPMIVLKSLLEFTHRNFIQFYNFFHIAKFFLNFSISLINYSIADTIIQWLV